MKIPNVVAEARIGGYHRIHGIGDEIRFVGFERAIRLRSIPRKNAKLIRGQKDAVRQSPIAPPKILLAIDGCALRAIEV